MSWCANLLAKNKVSGFYFSCPQSISYFLLHFYFVRLCGCRSTCIRVHDSGKHIIEYEKRTMNECRTYCKPKTSIALAWKALLLSAHRIGLHIASVRFAFAVSNKQSLLWGCLEFHSLFLKYQELVDRTKWQKPCKGINLGWLIRT